MFDKTFGQDERVMLHRWERLFARFRIVVEAGRSAAAEERAIPRFRDVLADTVAELLEVERELARFGRSPAAELAAADRAVWRPAAEWVAALREWVSPPVGWDALRVEHARTRRLRLEAQVIAAVAAYHRGEPDEGDEFAPHVVPVAVRSLPI